MRAGPSKSTATISSRFSRSCGPPLRLPVPGSESETLTLEFRSLDDFHPDALYDSCEWLRELPELAPRAPATPAAPEALPPAGPDSVSLDDLLDDPGSATGAEDRRAPDPWDHMLHDLVAPTPGARRGASGAAPATFEALAAGMRALLRHPAFQDLEAAWRALWYIVRHVETGSDLKIAILDVSRAELAADLEASREDLRASAVWRVVVGEAARTPGARPLVRARRQLLVHPTGGGSAIAGADGRGRTQEGGAPFLAAASTHLLDNPPRAPFRQLRVAAPRPLDRLGHAALAAAPALRRRHLAHRAVRCSRKWNIPSTKRIYGAIPRSPAPACWRKPSGGPGGRCGPDEVRDLEELPLHIYKEGGRGESEALRGDADDGRRPPRRCSITASCRWFHSRIATAYASCAFSRSPIRPPRSQAPGIEGCRYRPRAVACPDPRVAVGPRPRRTSD